MRAPFTRLLCLFAATTSVLATGTAASAAPAAPDPVVFVHGWNGSSWNWDQMVADFAADGYPEDRLFAWDYDTAQSNETTARELAVYVDEVLARTGASKVDLVSHSMGGLNTRWYVKFLGGDQKVDDYVSLAGPNHGTESAKVCAGSQPACADMVADSPFLTTLNEGDETPGSPTYGTWWSPCDQTIRPQESTILAGARNTEKACVLHIDFTFNDEVSREVRAFVS